MKKTKLLSMLTAGAIVCTTFGTFAAWDTLTTNKDVTITTAKAGTVTIESKELDFGTMPLSDTNNSVTAEFGVTALNASNLDLSASEITLGGSAATDDMVKVEFLNADDSAFIPSDPSDTLTTYKVKVTLSDPALADNGTKYAGKEITFKINATITK